jgi:hypothetical protein
MRIHLLIPLVVFVFDLSAQTIPAVGNSQLPVIEAPQAPNPIQYQSQSQPSDPYNPNESTDIRRRNEALINEATEYQRRIDSKLQKEADIRLLTTKGFPSQSYQNGTACYYQAFDEIQNMLQGKQSMNLGRAIFVVENAYYDNALNYTDFRKTIKDNAMFCYQKIRQEKLNMNSNMVKNMMIFRFISDTLKIKQQGMEKMITHLPVKYDYDDYKSEKNFDSHFVTKLLRSQTGQCYSMPLYYLILAEEMGSKAYWSFSPMHSFVKIQDDNGGWSNLELTCNGILSDAHYMNNSYIKAEAIRHRIYLEPMDKKEIIADRLLELARGYYKKYGLDDFYLKCIDTATQYLSNHVNALILKDFYEERLTMTLAYLLDAKKPEIMKEKSPEAYKHYEKMQELNKQIDDLGYEDLPASVYATWLSYIAKQKEKSEKQKSILINQQ